MHVVGAQPKYLSRSAVPEEALAGEKAVLMEQALKSGGWVGSRRSPAPPTAPSPLLA